MTLSDLQNIRNLLNRVPVTGPEAIVWCQVVQALDAAIAAEPIRAKIAAQATQRTAEVRRAESAAAAAA